MKQLSLFTSQEQCEHSFKEAMKLEAVNPLSPENIHVATVTRVKGQYIWLSLEGEMTTETLVDGFKWTITICTVFFSAVLRRKCWHSIWMAAENKFAANYAKGKVHLCLSIVCLPPVLYVLLLSIIYFCCPTIYIFIPCTVGVEHPHFSCTCAMTTKAYSILLFWK